MGKNISLTGSEGQLMKRYITPSSSLCMSNFCGPGLPSLMCYPHVKGLCLGDQRKREN